IVVLGGGGRGGGGGEGNGVLCENAPGGLSGGPVLKDPNPPPPRPAELEREAFMRNASRRGPAVIASCVMLAAAVVALVSASTAAAQSARVEELVSAVVRINTHINPEGRTVQGLGREREGSGIVIDSDGLVLTIG